MSDVWIKKLAPLVKTIPPSGIRRYFDLAAETEGVISLGVGEPDFVTPWHIREACIYSLEKGYTMYTSNQGLLELREEIAHFVFSNYRVQYDPRREILVTVGVSEGIDLALRAILCPGDEVIIPEPCYVSYKPCTIIAGGIPVTIPTREENNFQVTVEEIEKAITPRTKAIILSYPNNPTGAVLDRALLQEICDLACRYDLIVLSDEVYDQLTYEGSHTCVASLPGMQERTILFNGFSKAFAMTGWRLGYVAGHPDIISAMNKIHQYTMLCAPITAQMGALEALQKGFDEMKKMVMQYNQRRKLIVKGLRQMGLDCFEPKGAFYVFPNIKSTGLSSEEFATRLLKETQVAVVGGNAFGESGEGYIRCSYASSTQNIIEALERMAPFVQKYIRKNRQKAAMQ